MPHIQSSLDTARSAGANLIPLPGEIMAKIIALHQSDALTLPLAGGAALRATPFRETARVALTLFGPGGGNAGGVILGASRARLLGSWLLRMADAAGSDAPDRPRPARRVMR